MKKILLVVSAILLFGCSIEQESIIDKEFEPTVIESYPFDSLSEDDTIYDTDFSNVTDWTTKKLNEGKVVKIYYDERTNQYIAYIIKDTCNICQ